MLSVRDVQFGAFEPAEWGNCQQCHSTTYYEELQDNACKECKSVLCNECSEWYDGKCESCFKEND